MGFADRYLQGKTSVAAGAISSPGWPCSARKFLRRDVGRCWSSGVAGASADVSTTGSGGLRFDAGHVCHPLYHHDKQHAALVPPAQPAHLPAINVMSSPGSTTRKSRRNFVSTCIVRPGHAWLYRGDKSTPRPKSMWLFSSINGQTFFSATRFSALLVDALACNGAKMANASHLSVEP